MAFIGLRCPVIAPITTESTTSAAAEYGTGVVLDKMMSANITPNIDESDLYGDDDVAESYRAFRDCDIVLGTTHLPTDAVSTMFGATVTPASTGSGTATPLTIEDTDTDSPKYVGFGFIRPEVLHGVTSYWVVLLHKTKFVLPADEMTTKGENVEWQTPTVNGKAYKDARGKWRKREQYATFAAARTALFAALNVSST